jgi:mono/diheme cytochrome c family protein
MKTWKISAFIGVALIVVVVAYATAIVGRGFSARNQPSVLEARIARGARNLSIPRKAKDAKNRFAATPVNLKESREHFADHCASCHANNGSGQTEMGQNLYPKAPDMRLAGTQNLSDGEIYYIIHNGIRLTGMPAWGDADNDPDSWKLVLFIRHLPALTADEEKDMERFNPKSEADRAEEEEEERFLNGDDLKDKKNKSQTEETK